MQMCDPPAAVPGTVICHSTGGATSAPAAWLDTEGTDVTGTISATTNGTGR